MRVQISHAEDYQIRSRRMTNLLATVQHAHGTKDARSVVPTTIVISNPSSRTIPLPQRKEVHMSVKSAVKYAMLVPSIS